MEKIPQIILLRQSGELCEREWSIWVVMPHQMINFTIFAYLVLCSDLCVRVGVCWCFWWQQTDNKSRSDSENIYQKMLFVMFVAECMNEYQGDYPACLVGWVCSFIFKPLKPAGISRGILCSSWYSQQWIMVMANKKSCENSEIKSKGIGILRGWSSLAINLLCTIFNLLFKFYNLYYF